MTDSAPVAADPRTVPGEIDRWNWGAFFLNWIWGIGNGTPIALLALVPGLGLIMLFVLGVKGSSWAWRNKRWDSVAHFKRVQRNWAIAGLIVWVAVGLFFASVFGGVFSVLKNSEAYQLGLARLQASPAAVSVLGTPITNGLVTGSIHFKGDAGDADLSFSASGPRTSGVVTLQAVKKDGVWTITRMTLKPDGKDELIDLVGGRNSST